MWCWPGNESSRILFPSLTNWRSCCENAHQHFQMAVNTSRVKALSNCNIPAVIAGSRHRVCRHRHTSFKAYAVQSNVSAEPASLEQQSAQPGSSPFPGLEAACSVNKAAIGLNKDGFRGLLAATNIAPGEVVLTIPLHNMLQVPRQLTQPHMQSMTEAALTSWQQQHWNLPDELLSFLTQPNVIWESKLVAWLLFLGATAPVGSLWHSYCQSLPAAADAITFCSYSEQHVEQLQLSTWKVRSYQCDISSAAGLCKVLKSPFSSSCQLSLAVS